MKKKKIVAGAISLAILIPILLYGTGIIAQFIININAWKAAGSNYRESPGLPSLEIGDVLSAVFTFPEGLIAVWRYCAFSASASAGAILVQPTMIGT